MKLFGERPHELSGDQVLTAISSLSFKSTLSTLEKGEAHRPNSYDKLRGKIVTQTSPHTMEGESDTSYVLDLSLRERYLIKRALKFVRRNEDEIANAVTRKEHQLAGMLAPQREYPTPTEVQNRSFDAKQFAGNLVGQAEILMASL